MIALLSYSPDALDRALSLAHRLRTALETETCTVSLACSVGGVASEADKPPPVQELVDAHLEAGADLSLVVLEETDAARLARVAFWLRRSAEQRVVHLPLDPEMSVDVLAGRLKHQLAHGPCLEPWQPPRPQVLTQRLTLTWPEPAQVRGYFEAIHGTDMFDWLLWDGPGAPGDLADFYLWSARQTLATTWAPLELGVVHTESGRLIGGGSLRPTGPGVMELGYTLAPAWQGQGLGRELVEALVTVGIAHRGARRLTAHVFVGNERSAGLLTLLGFTDEGIARGSALKHQQPVDQHVYALMASEWRGAGSIQVRALPPGWSASS